MKEELKSTHSAIMTVDEYIGVAVKRYREKAKVKQAKFAKYLGVSSMQLSYLERGKRSWKVKDLVRVGEVLGFVIQIKDTPIPDQFKDINNA